MGINELKEKLLQLSSCKNIQNLQETMAEFNPESHKYGEPPWFYHGHMDYPAVEFFKRGFDQYSIIVSSFSAEGGGPFLGYRYYKDKVTAFDNEIRRSFSGCFYLWKESGGEAFEPTFLLQIKECSSELTSLLNNLIPPGNTSDFDQIVQFLEQLKEQHFALFTSIREHVSQWNLQSPLYIAHQSSLAEEYRMKFGKPFEEIDLSQNIEFAWAVLKLPPSDLMI